MVSFGFTVLVCFLFVLVCCSLKASLVKVQAGLPSHACAVSLGFFRVMQSAMQYANLYLGGQLRFILYHDGVTPGNNLRPDCGRSFVSFLWSWLDLPIWLRSRERLRWITCTYVGKRDMKQHKITVMHWSPGLNLKCSISNGPKYEHERQSTQESITLEHIYIHMLC